MSLTRFILKSLRRYHVKVHRYTRRSGGWCSCYLEDAEGRHVAIRQSLMFKDEALARAAFWVEILDTFTEWMTTYRNLSLGVLETR